MFGTPKLFWTIFTLCTVGCLSLKECDDCIPIQLCDIASNLLENDKSAETFLIIRNSICYKTQQREKITGVSVCCSDFIVGRMQIDDDIENHKNRHLLPNAKDCGRIHGTKLIGGVNAALNEFPWMALILNRYKNPICGASLINERYILTAAHCVNGLPKSTKVRLGEYDLNKRRDCDPVIRNYCIRHKDFDISEVKVHKFYKNYPYMINDIALVRLATPVNFLSDNILPICLPTPLNIRNRRLDEKMATIAGWGQTENSDRSRVLRKAEILVLDKTTCESYYSSSGDQSRFCAGTEGKDTCKGDSGGPLMIEDKYYDSYKVVQYGIVSYGYITCNGIYPGVYVDVRPHMKWILDNIEP